MLPLRPDAWHVCSRPLWNRKCRTFLPPLVPRTLRGTKTTPQLAIRWNFVISSLKICIVHLAVKLTDPLFRISDNLKIEDLVFILLSYYPFSLWSLLKLTSMWFKSFNRYYMCTSDDESQMVCVMQSDATNRIEQVDQINRENPTMGGYLLRRLYLGWVPFDWKRSTDCRGQEVERTTVGRLMESPWSFRKKHFLALVLHPFPLLLPLYW